VTLDRHIALEGAVNFRDLGGYSTDEGRRTRWRVLFRADGLSELTEPDIAVLREIGIRTVIDLRSGDEVEQSRFDVEAHPVTFHHFPFVETLPDLEEFERTPGFFPAKYVQMVEEAGTQIVAALTALAEPGALPAVFHCTAGKDRTGVLSALVLSLLGVPEETVVADYALSGNAMARLRTKLAAKHPESMALIAGADVVFSADPANMVALFAHVHDRYGSPADYAAAVGVPDDVVAHLRESLLESDVV
jgi:protein tyrosine/serine phosphatase